MFCHFCAASLLLARQYVEYNYCQPEEPEQVWALTHSITAELFGLSNYPDLHFAEPCHCQVSIRGYNTDHIVARCLLNSAHSDDL